MGLIPVDKSMKGCGAVGKSRRAAPRSPPCATGSFITNPARETMAVTLALLALLFEAAVGYPEWLLRAIGHPVIWIGRLIGLLELVLNRDELPYAARRNAGIAAVVLLVVASGVTGFVVEKYLLLLPYGMLFAALAASSMLAQRSLHAHVAAVATALEQGGVAAGRE